MPQDSALPPTNREDSDGVFSTDAMVDEAYTALRRYALAKLADEKPGHTLQATALVNEAYLRLAGEKWESKRQFLAAASQAMRRILIDSARRKHAVKRGRDLDRTMFWESQISAGQQEDDVLAVDDALERLEQVDPESAEIVKLRFFIGLGMAEIAELMGVSRRTIGRQWRFARSWLRREIQQT